MTRIARALFTAALLVTTHGWAQDLKDEGFFGKDFAQSGGQDERKENAPPTPTIEGGGLPDIGVHKDPPKEKQEMGFIGLGEDPAKKPVSQKKSGKPDKDDIIPEPINTGDKIDSIELIFSNEDDLKFGMLLNKYIQILTTRELDSRGVTIVLKKGEASEYMQLVVTALNTALSSDAERQAAELTQEQADLMKPEDAQTLVQNILQSPFLAKRIQSTMLTHVSWDLPPEYPIKQLPSWVLHTGKGAIVLEGIEDPSEMITKNGKFVEPQAGKVS